MTTALLISIIVALLVFFAWRNARRERLVREGKVGRVNGVGYIRYTAPDEAVDGLTPAEWERYYRREIFKEDV